MKPTQKIHSDWCVHKTPTRQAGTGDRFINYRGGTTTGSSGVICGRRADQYPRRDTAAKRPSDRLPGNPLLQGVNIPLRSLALNHPFNTLQKQKSIGVDHSHHASAGGAKNGRIRGIFLGQSPGEKPRFPRYSRGVSELNFPPKKISQSPTFCRCRAFALFGLCAGSVGVRARHRPRQQKAAAKFAVSGKMSTLRRVQTMANIKYPYPRADLTIRVSENLLDLLHEACSELRMSVQDLSAYCLLQMLDPSEKICPDWRVLHLNRKKIAYRKALLN